MINNIDYMVGTNIDQYQCNETDTLVEFPSCMRCGCVCKFQHSVKVRYVNSNKM